MKKKGLSDCSDSILNLTPFDNSLIEYCACAFLTSYQIGSVKDSYVGILIFVNKIYYIFITFLIL